MSHATVEFPNRTKPPAVLAFAEANKLTFDKVEVVNYEAGDTCIQTGDVNQLTAWAEALGRDSSIYNNGGYWYVSNAIDGDHTLHVIYMVERVIDDGADEPNLGSLILRLLKT